MLVKAIKARKIPQSNKHEIVLVLDKLQTLVSLGVHCVNADKIPTLPNSHPFYPFRTPIVPYTAIRSDLAVVCASCASAFYFFRRKAPYPSL